VLDCGIVIFNLVFYFRAITTEIKAHIIKNSIQSKKMFRSLELQQLLEATASISVE
jgi:hypothetical protein